MILLTYKRFCPFSYIEGVIYRGGYMHQKGLKPLKLLLKEPVFIVVQRVVLKFLRAEF